MYVIEHVCAVGEKSEAMTSPAGERWLAHQPHDASPRDRFFLCFVLAHDSDETDVKILACGEKKKKRYIFKYYIFYSIYI